jgi:hypothetical protein
MPYQGTLVSLAEMLEMLGTRRRSEAVAALELERAFEDKAIVLRLRDGSDSEGEALYRTLTDAEMSAVITVLRDFPNRMRIPYIRHMNIPFEMVKAACALRVQFETRCDLLDRPAAPPMPATPMSRESAVRACIEAGMIPASTATWDAFCEQVRDRADGWADKKMGILKRGFDEKTIKRDVKRIMN